MSKYDIVLCYKCKLTKNSLNNQDFKQKLEPGAVDKPAISGAFAREPRPC